MNIVFHLFSITASAFSLYSLLCIVRVLFTWIPDLNYSPFGKILARICDPWLSAFRKFNFMKNSPFDISPVIAVGILVLISSILKQIVHYRSFSLGIIVSVILQILWSVVSSLLTFFNILLFVRLVAELLNKTQSRIWDSVDRVLNPIIYKIPAFFSRSRYIQPKYAMLVTLAFGLILRFGAGSLINRLIEQLSL